MKNTLEVECLIQALQKVLEAKIEHDKERDGCDGYSWGYYGQRFVDSMENAADEFGSRLDALIEKKVTEALDRERSNAKLT